MAVLAGKIMLENGAETYRVEDTILRLCMSRKEISYAEIFVIPTGIFLSGEYMDDVMSFIQRTKTKRIDLNRISLVNDFSRRFVNSDMSIDEGFAYLKEIDSVKAYPRPVKLFFGGVAGGFFSILFGGTFFDFASTFTISLLVVLSLDFLGKYNMTFFVNNFIGAVVGSGLSILFYELGLGINLDTMIIGSIMPLVPGVAITNATRDSISGDFLAGMSRGIEAFIIALSIAFGVGIMLQFYF